MKLARLFLKAFGPFTDRVLDLSASPANLHLVYGPNEAGKSSALRAMGDLRFGIPLRSADSFVHPYERMRVGGALLDGDGRLLGLMRHKGRGGTLARCCPTSGEPLPGEPLRPEHEAALTAGLTRAEFEAMFGLDHPRLRRGGRELIEGRGELGAALFEASAGTQGVAALMESLEAEAKKLYSPRASTSTINEARRQIEDARQACKAALTKPAQWRLLQRAHEEAREALRQAEQELGALRAQLAELSELRTVAPLLRQQALLEAECATLADAPELPPDAAEQRQRAQDALALAQADGQAAQTALQAAQDALARVAVDERALEHAAMIERLLAAREQVAQGRAELQQIEATLAQAQEDFALRAARIAPGAAAAVLLQARPSEGDEAAIRQHLDAFAQLDARLQLLREQQARLREQLQSADAQQAPAPDPQRLRRLAEALGAARGLGDLPARLDAARLRRRQLAERLQQALHDLGLPEVEALARLRPLLDAQIDETAQALDGIAQAARTLHDERGRLQHDEAAQQLRLRALQAGGEVATPAALREARRRRDEGWHRIRQAGLPGTDETAARDDRASAAALAASFEAAVAEADRLADLLQRDADRAAKVEECEVRIGQMRARRTEIDAQLAELALREQALQEGWQRLLQAHGLPPLGPEALRQWQMRGAAAREQALQLAEATRAEAELDEAGRQGRGALCAALAQDLPEDDGLQDLPWPALLACASAREQALREAQAGRAAFETTQRRLRADCAAAGEAIATAEALQATHHEALSRWHGRLLLPQGSGAAAVQARLQELASLAALHEQTAARRMRRDALHAQARSFADTAADLARLLDEPPPILPDSLADRLAHRLAAARESLRRRELCLKDRSAAEAALARAVALAAGQEAALDRLCEAAGGVARDELAGVQARALRRSRARSALDELRLQVAQAASRPPEELARRLGELEVAALETQRTRCAEAIGEKEAALAVLREREREARAALAAIDTSDEAAVQREALESAAARLRSAIPPWTRLKLASALLHEALKRFRERAQGPMLGEASRYFGQMTGGRYVRLVVDEREQGPVLLAERADGQRVALDAMSEGTADQLYLALRLAAQAVRQSDGPQGRRFAMPLVLDDVLMTSDDERALHILQALQAFSAHGQVLLFTHHRHLHELAGAAFAADQVGLHRL